MSNTGENQVVRFRRGQKPAAVRAWRRHPKDSIKEVERLEMGAEIKRLGWSRPKLTRVMNTVGSEDGFRFRVHEALQEQADPLIYSRKGAPRAQREDGDVAPEDDLNARGYITNQRSLGLDGVPVPHPDEVPKFTKSIEARERFEKVKASERERREAEQMAGKVRALYKRAEKSGAGIEFLEPVKDALEVAEEELKKAA